MARIRDINNIDEDEDGQLVDCSGDSDDGNKSEEDLPEETFRRRPAPGLVQECIGLPGQHPCS
jgi:hypothetical protein